MARERTELFLDDLEDLLLVEFLGETLDSRQGLTTIALCWLKSQSARRLSQPSSICVRRGVGAEKKRIQGQTYAEYGCVYNSATASSHQYLRRLRRRGLYHTNVSYGMRIPCDKTWGGEERSGWQFCNAGWQKGEQLRTMRCFRGLLQRLRRRDSREVDGRLTEGLEVFD